jgi:FkbM family methyltransferase
MRIAKCVSAIGMARKGVNVMKEYQFYGETVCFSTDVPNNFKVRLGETLSELQFLNFIYDERFIKPNTVWLDIGANIGNHTVSLAKTHSSSRCISVEANETIFQVLKGNVELNELSNVDLLCNGVSSKSGLTFSSYFNDKQIGASTITIKDSHGLNSRHTVSIDSLIPKDIRVSFIKIDCEGHDLEVLKGAEQTIIRDRPTVALEIWKPNVWEGLRRKDPKEEIFSIFEKINYVLTYTDGSDNFVFEPQSGVEV